MRTRFSSDAVVDADVRADHLLLAGADVVAHNVAGAATGYPSVSRHRFGSGVGWYVSTRLSTQALSAVFEAAYGDAGVAPAGLPDGVEVVRRHGPALWQERVKG